MANLLFFPAPHSRCSIIIFEAADNHRRHDLADRCRISAFRGGSHRHVAVNDDAEGLLALTDQHVSSVMRRHPPGNLLYWGISADYLHVSAHDIFELYDLPAFRYSSSILWRARDRRDNSYAPACQFNFI
jgi:hypothetical protein